MNTPDPCTTCGNNYSDTMQKNNPDYVFECMDKSGKAKVGDKNCPCFTIGKWYNTYLKNIIVDKKA